MTAHSEPATFATEARRLPVERVTVYADRAEVRRALKFEAAAGRTRVIISNVSSVMESQSLQVDGKRSATILEVFYVESPAITVVDGETDEPSATLHAMEASKARLESACLALDDELHILRKRLEVLDGVAGQIGQNVLVASDVEAARQHKSLGSTPASAFLLCEEAMKNLTSFLDYYGTTVTEMKKKLREKEAELLALRQKLESVDRDLDQQRCKFEYDNHRRSINIVIEMEEAGLAEIEVIYQVYCAKWRPCYDIRASTSAGVENSGAPAEANRGASTNAEAGAKKNSNAATVPGLTVFYYGLVEQTSDEDWRDAKLVLSTATPALAGVLPAPAALSAAFQRAQHHPSNSSRNALSQRARKSAPLSHASQEEDVGIGSYDYNEFGDAAAVAFHRLHHAPLPPPPPAAPTAVLGGVTRAASSDGASQISEHLPSTYFTVEEPASILSNGQYHKVLISKMELTPSFSHDTIPSRSATAFVSFTAPNSTDLPLLPGAAAIFLNNTFISTQHLRAIMPGDAIQCLLGVDNSVKVDYKPAQKHHEQVGFMSKSVVCTHEQNISLRNTKERECVRITVREPIPRPADDKIRVSVLAPDVKNARGGGTDAARLTADNNLEWACVLAPGEARQLLVKWTSEFPAGESVLFFPSGANGARAGAQRIC